MKSAEDIKRYFQQATLSTNPNKHEAVFEEIQRAQDQSQKVKRVCNQALLRRIIMKTLMTKAAAVILICTGVAAAAVVGAKIYKWRFIGKDPERGYLLQSEDGRSTTNVPEGWADSPELAVKVREELDLLKQRGDGELISVIEKEVNGKLISRYLRFKYVLADGREIKSGELDPDFKRTGTLTEAQEEEIVNLLRTDKYVTIGHEKKEVRGRMLCFERNQFVLSDGTEVIWSRGTPEDDR